MKAIFIFSGFTRRLVLPIAFVLFITIGVPLAAQTTATEDFENEATGSTTFSESSINFNHTFSLVNISGYGHGGSSKFLEVFMTGSTTILSPTISINNSLNPNVSFKINSFTGYLAAGGSGLPAYNGSVLVSGVPVGGGSPVSANIAIASASGTLPTGQLRDGSGNVSGLNFTGTALDGLYFTSLTFTIVDTDLSNGNVGVRYLAMDHINFTTQVPVTNQFSISDASILEGSSGTKQMAFTVSRSSTTAAGSVTVQSSNGTATAGSDYVAFPATVLNFPAGGTASQTVNVTINGDVSIESDETFTMNLSNAVGGTIARATGVGTILDDDNITETFEDETVGATTTTFSQLGFTFASNGSLYVSRGNNIGSASSTGLDTKVGNGGSTGNVGSFYITSPGVSFNLNSVELFTSNNDGVSGTTGNVNVTFTGVKADGSGSVSHTASVSAFSGFNFKTVSFSGTPLANVQLLSVSVTLGTGANYISLDNIKYGTVTFNPGVLLSINDVSVLEGTGGGTSNATFTVTRSANTSTFSVDVASSDLSAVAGSDYTAFSTTLNFVSGGALSQTVTVTILRDATAEANETFNMTLSNATNGVLYQKQVGLGTILDDDRITETFEDETNSATSFSQNSVAFSASGRLKVANSSTNGSNSSSFYLTSGVNANGGTVGKITLSTANTGFKLLQLDAWVGSGSGPAFGSGPVTFTGTLYGGGTVATIKTVTATSNNGGGWHKNITFTGTPLENALLTALEFSVGGSMTTLDIDNFTFAPFATTPHLEVTDISDNSIANGGAATTVNSTDYGTSCLPGSISKTFTIKNTGAVNLVLTGTPLAIVGGANPAQFTVTSPPVSPVLPGASTDFTIAYAPTTTGSHNASVTFTSNDVLNSPIVVNLKGTAVLAVNVSSQPANQVMSGNGTTGNGNAVFSIAATNATYQWQVKTGSDSYANLANSAPYSGVTTNTLTVANPAISLTGAIYRCVLTGCSVVNSTDASLQIVSPGATLPSGTLTGTDITTGTDAGWTFYSDNGNVGFAIQWNGNAGAKSDAVVSTTNGTTTSGIRNPAGAIYAMGRYWNVTSSALGTPVNIRFYYAATDRSGVTGSATTYATTNSVSNDGFRWVKTTGEAYSPANITSGGITGNSIILTGTDAAVNGIQQTQFNGVTGFSGGTGVATAGFQGGPLPVNLLYFKVEKSDDGSVNTLWATVSEKASDYFMLERSSDGRDFTQVGTLQAGGVSSTQKDYSFRDIAPNPGINYYRLSEIAEDGAITRYPMKAISMGREDAIQVYPNPAEGRHFYVANTAALNGATISLRTVTGRLLSSSHVTVSATLQQVTVHEGLATGIYLVTIKTASGKEITQRLLVK